MNDQLTQLADKYGADKSPNIKHGYTPFYYGLFSNIKDDVHQILEIGIAEGASLFMWRDFFSNAMIYGADNDELRVEHLEMEDRIVTFVLDQADVESINWKDIPENLDIIIDDGSHKPEDQLLSCLSLMPKLSKHGIYIIEDVDDNWAETIFKILNNKYDCRMVKFGSRHDDRVIVVKHK